MRFDRPLDELFRTRSHVRILRALDELPQAFATSAREIARRAGVSHPTASSALESFAEQGVVLRRRAARGDAFELNREQYFLPGIAALLTCERRLLEELKSFIRREIRREAPSVIVSYLFGSVVRSQATSSSDIDVAVICSPDAVPVVSEAMHRVAEAVRLRFGNPVNTIVASHSMEELQDGRRPGHRLWRRIAREGVPLTLEDR